jgi:hypothetical protein
MLTNGFSKSELAACTPGAKITCIEEVVMLDTGKHTFTAGQAYEVLSATDWLLTLKNNDGRQHHMYGNFFRKHFAVGQLLANSKN